MKTLPLTLLLAASIGFLSPAAYAIKVPFPPGDIGGIDNGGVLDPGKDPAPPILFSSLSPRLRARCSPVRCCGSFNFPSANAVDVEKAGTVNESPVSMFLK